MQDSEIIVTLTRRNLMLEQQLQELKIEHDDAVEARDNLKGHIEDIQKALDYCGHPGNTVDILKRRLAGN